MFVWVGLTLVRVLDLIVLNCVVCCVHVQMLLCVIMFHIYATSKNTVFANDHIYTGRLNEPDVCLWETPEKWQENETTHSMSTLTTDVCAHRRGQSYWLNCSSSSKGMLGFGRKKKMGKVHLLHITLGYSNMCISCQIIFFYLNSYVLISYFKRIVGVFDKYSYTGMVSCSEFNTTLNSVCF